MYDQSLFKKNNSFLSWFIIIIGILCVMLLAYNSSLLCSPITLCISYSLTSANREDKKSLVLWTSYIDSHLMIMKKDNDNE